MNYAEQSSRMTHPDHAEAVVALLGNIVAAQKSWQKFSIAAAAGVFQRCIWTLGDILVRKFPDIALQSGANDLALLRHRNSTATLRCVTKPSRLALVVFLLACELGGHSAHAKPLDASEKTAVVAHDTDSLVVTHGVIRLLGSAYALIAQHDLIGAEDALLEARRIDPNNHWVAINLGFIYLATARPAQADLEYQRVNGGASGLSFEKFNAAILSGKFDELPSRKTPAVLMNLAAMRAAWNASFNRKPAVSADPGLEPSTTSTSSFLQQTRMPNTPDGGCSLESATDHVQAWASAWRTGDVDRYIAAYVNDYQGDRSSARNWRGSRRNTILAAKKIDLRLDEITMRIEHPCEAVAVFRQKYRSVHFSDQGIKTLRLARKGNRWGISHESFSGEVGLESSAAAW